MSVIVFKLDKNEIQVAADGIVLSDDTIESNDFKKIFKSITVDNGAEFSDAIGMEKSIFNGKRTDVYYCHPYSSWERGSNERMNREIRRLIPKGSNISTYTAAQIKQVQDWVNSYPREIFGYATSEELFQAELERIA